MQWKTLSHRVSLVLSCLLASTALSYVQAGELAGKADDFVDSIGVNIKTPSYGNYGLVYSNTTLVESKLAELGIRYYRVNAKDEDGDWAFCNQLYLDHGIQADMQVTWTFTSLSNRLQTNAAMLTSVEGPNETDNASLGFTYKGLGFPAGTTNFQNDLYNMVKNGPATANLPVIVPSVITPGDELQLIGSIGDYENMHSYPAGKAPTFNLDTPMIAYANTLFSPDKPIASTETGYHTALSGTAPVSEKAQGKYMPRLLCEYWNRDVVRTYTYELFDESNSQTDPEMAYGILHNDGTPKPAFTAEKNLIGLLAEPGTNFTPGGFSYSLSDNNTNVHHLILQKSNGDFYFLIWQDILTFNSGTKTDITNADVPMTLFFATPVGTATTFRYDNLGNLVTNSATISGNSIVLSIPDTVLFVKLTPGTPIATAPDAPTNLGAVQPGNVGSISLTWNATLGATSYKVKRATSSTGSYTIIASGVPDSNYVDTNTVNGTAYYYMVSAVDSYGESPNSNIATPDIIKDNADASGVSIAGSWSSSTGVPGFFGTNFLYASSGSGASVRFTPSLPATTSYDVYARWTAFTNRTTNTPIYIISATGTSSSNVNEQVNGGVWVWLGTFSFNAGTGGSVLVTNAGSSGVVVADAVRFVQRIPPVAPSGLTATNVSSTQINLAWTATAGATSYNVKRSTGSPGSYTTIATGVTTTSYSDTGLTPGTTYFYVVSAVNDSGESLNSNIATPEIIKDNADSTGITITGSWSSSSGITGYYGTNYLYAPGNTGANVRFTPTIPATNNYDVYIRWAANPNRATNTPVDVINAAGTNTFSVNQQVNGGTWILLGTFPFNTGTAGGVKVRNNGVNATNFVVADAVKFVWK